MVRGPLWGAGLNFGPSVTAWAPNWGVWSAVDTALARRVHSADTRLHYHYIGIRELR